jgi:hypothetical protein
VLRVLCSTLRGRGHETWGVPRGVVSKNVVAHDGFFMWDVNFSSLYTWETNILVGEEVFGPSKGLEVIFGRGDGRWCFLVVRGS